MNIFALDVNPSLAAKYHNNRHCVKMILESAQILCTVCHLTYDKDATKYIPYKPTHTKHPSVMWVAESLDNWIWLRTLMVELNSEYKFRYDKTNNHKSYDLTVNLPIPNLPKIGLTPFKLAMPDDVKVIFSCVDAIENSILNYRKYYIEKKQHLAKWTKRDIPYWYCNNHMNDYEKFQK